MERAPGTRFRPFDVSEAHLGFDEYDVVNQGLISHHFSLIDGAWERNSIPFRYVWPAELDLMAQLAGFELETRDADWRGTEFTAESRSHVSVYRLVTVPSS
jgi:hypothetical protein